MRLIPIAAAAFLLMPSEGHPAELPIPVLAAQSFYGEAAEAIGGERVSVASVLVSPDVDPHDFEPAPSVARAVADARIVVFNGADYDHWMERLLESAERPDRVVIEAALLIGVAEGGNPHVWYDPRTMKAVAGALAEALAGIDPDGAEEYETRRQALVAALAPMDAKIAAMRQRFEGTPVTATEPVFGPMAEALGLDMTNEAFQEAIMSETEPSAREIAAIEDDLRNNRVRALLYNSQVADALTEHLLAVARAANVPVVGVSEIAPDGTGYADWMLGQLESLEKALAGPSS